MSNSDLECPSPEVSDACSDVSILANIVHGSVSNGNVGDTLKEQKIAKLRDEIEPEHGSIDSVVLL